MRTWFTDQHIRFLLIANLIVLVAAAALSGGQFLDPFNLQNMAKQLPEVGLLAIGVSLAMISGSAGIDLSVVSIANLSGVTAGLIARSLFSGEGQGVMFTLAFVTVALVVGFAAGLTNGILISRIGFTPILATLGTQLVFTGLAVALSGGPAVSLGYIEPFVQIGNGTLLGIPVPFLIFAVVIGIVSWTLGSTRFGFRLYLAGSNAKAARYAGIDAANVLLYTYVASGVIAAIAGIVFASSASSAKWDFGSSYLLIAILIAVMGGINPDGGYGKIAGLVLAAVALQLLSSGLNFLGMSNFLKDFMWGVLLLLSIMLTRLRFRRAPAPPSTSPPARAVTT
jgi:simple sugar transport system permease protein